MLLGILFPSINYAANPTNDVLTSLLGEMPEKLPLQTDTLEQTPLNGGMRYKIRYFIEQGNNTLGTPDDWGYAYLFVPKLPTGKKAPAIVAMHQDDIYFHIGKSEPAGLIGDSTMCYGKELFERGYIVICPDLFIMPTAARHVRIGVIFLPKTSKEIFLPHKNVLEFCLPKAAIRGVKKPLIFPVQ